MAKNPYVELDENTVSNALLAIGEPESWEELVKIGTAVKSALGENGRSIFVDYAETTHWGKSNPDRSQKHNFSSAFTGYDTSRVKSGTLVYLANERTGGAFSRENVRGTWQETPEYRAEKERRRAKLKAETEAAERRKIQADAQKSAEVQKWFQAGAYPAKASHPYLKRKGIDDVPAGLTYYNGAVQIPLYDKDGNIKAAQRIYGRKTDGMTDKPVTGAITGTSYLFGSLDTPQNGVILAEGFATAYSLHKATGLPAIMAVNSSNLDDVAAVYREKLPAGTPLVIAADNDSHKTNAGLKGAEKAAETYGAGAVVQMVRFTPETAERFRQQHGSQPTDYNDLALIAGYAAVKAQIDEALAQSRHLTANVPQAEVQQAAAFSPLQQQENKNMNEQQITPDNLNALRQMSETEFISLLAGQVQNGTMTATADAIARRFDDDYLDGNPVRLSASYETALRVGAALDSIDGQESARQTLAAVETRMNMSDDPMALEIAEQAEIRAKQWREDTTAQPTNVQPEQHSATPAQIAHVTEVPEAVHTAREETADEKETQLKHFRENQQLVRESSERAAHAAAGLYEDLQQDDPVSSSVVNKTAPENQPTDSERQDNRPAPPEQEAKQQAEDKAQTQNADGSNSIEQEQKQPAARQVLPSDMTEREYQRQILQAWDDGSLKKDFEKAAERMEKAKTPEKFRDHYAEYLRMAQAVEKLDNNPELKKLLGHKETGTFRQENAIEWQRLQDSMAKGNGIAGARTDEPLYQAAAEMADKAARMFRPSTDELETISADEIRRNMNNLRQVEAARPQTTMQAAEPEQTEQEKADRRQPDDPTEQQKEKATQHRQQQAAADTPKTIIIPERLLAERYLINRDRTQLLNENSGDPEIFIDNAKNRLRTEHSDFDTVSAMVEIARSNNWTEITVKGTPEFRKLMWQTASIHGITVKGYKPNKQELEYMQAMKDRLASVNATNTVDGRETVRQQERQDNRPTPSEQETKQQTEARQAAWRDGVPPLYTEKMSGTFGAGVVMEIGKKLFKPSAQKETPYMELETADGRRHTVWGMDLPRVIDPNGIKVGDRVALSRETEPVTVIENGKEMVKHRNIWTLEDYKPQHRQQQAATRQQPGYVGKIQETAQKMAGKQAESGKNVSMHKPPERIQIQPKSQQTQTQNANQGKTQSVRSPSR